MSSQKLPSINTKVLFARRNAKRSTEVPKRSLKKTKTLPKIVSLKRSLASHLTKIEQNFSKSQQKSSKNLQAQKVQKSSSKIKSRYTHFIHRCQDLGELEDSVLIYASCLLKRVVKSAKTGGLPLKQEDFIYLYSTCVFLSIKCLIDVEKWFIEDFAFMAKVEEDLIAELEIVLLNDLLEYKVIVDKEELDEENILIFQEEFVKQKQMKILKKNYEKAGPYSNLKNLSRVF